MNTRDKPVPFEARVNLVPIRVVVRDMHGKAVAGLRREDFQVFQDGKPQVISHFSEETASSATRRADSAPAEASPAGADASAQSAFAAPTRFVALLFDDPHLSLEDLTQARLAADRFVKNSLNPADRVAIFTVSGQMQSDFTDDRAKLSETMSHMIPQAVTAGDPTGNGECPPIDYYQADQIENKHDTTALNVATVDALACAFNNDTRQIVAAQGLAEAMALQKLSMGDTQTEYSLRRLKEIIQRVSALPGQRTIILISPGFIYPTREVEFSEIMDRANRANVFISTLDARGVYTPDLGGGDISDPNPGSPVAAGPRDRYRVTGQTAQTEILLEIADATGGIAFRNSNDFDTGFRTLGGVPETSYMLGFTPQNLKYDGKFHILKIAVAGKQKYQIQARRGFYAPKKNVTPTEAAEQEIEEAVYSQEELRSLPITIHTQFYKPAEATAKLAVLAHMDIARMQFDKAEGRNNNNLTIVTALFDRNGNYIIGNEKIVEMKLRDETLEKLNRTGVTVKSTFDVKPGGYMVRLVVRDSNSSAISSENGTVEIPY